MARCDQHRYRKLNRRRRPGLIEDGRAIVADIGLRRLGDRFQVLGRARSSRVFRVLRRHHDGPDRHRRHDAERGDGFNERYSALPSGWS